MTLTPGGRLRALTKAGLIAPGRVAVDGNGKVWVGDFFSLRGFGPSRRPETSFYDRFDAAGTGTATANTVSVDGDMLITTGWFTNSVQIIDPETGAVIADIRTLLTPTNAIRHGDVLADADTGPELLGGLGLPLGLASDGETLYVSDYITGTVWAVPAGGSAVALAHGLSSPEGLAIDGRRLLVVEEGRDQVSAIDLTTGNVTAVVTDLDLGWRVVPGALPNGIFNGVAVGPDGAIHVSDDGANAVYEFRHNHR